MAYLFIVENGVVKPTPETLIISPYKEIWDRDKTTEKEVAMAEFAYIEFMTSALKTNPFKGYGEKDKERKVRAHVHFTPEKEIDDLMKEAMAQIKEFQMNASESYSYYMSAKRAVAKMEHFNNTFDLNAVNEKTLNPIYKPKDITNSLKDTEAVLSNLSKLKTKVEEELYTAAKVRSGKVISSFANPNSFNEG